MKSPALDRLKREVFFRRQLKPWKTAEGKVSTNLLRLCLLKDLAKSIHGEKSRKLAKGQRRSADAYLGFEKKIESLLEMNLENKSLPYLLENRVSQRRILCPLPIQVYKAIPKDRFERLDRKWESAIAAEAARIGWNFWTLDAWVIIKKAQAFHTKLARALWPKGIVLFVESAPGNKHFKGNLWNGRWLIALDPKVTDPKDTVRLKSIEPVWTLQFKPRESKPLV